MGGNLPPGVTQADIDRHFGEPDPEPEPPEHERPHCAVCGSPLPWQRRRDDPALCDDCDEDDLQAKRKAAPDPPEPSRLQEDYERD